MKKKTVSQEEKERLAQLTENIDKLSKAVIQIQPTAEMYENIDKLLTSIKQIHNDALNKVEKLIEEFRDKNLWHYRESL